MPLLQEYQIAKDRPSRGPKPPLTFQWNARPEAGTAAPAMRQSPTPIGESMNIQGAWLLVKRYPIRFFSPQRLRTTLSLSTLIIPHLQRRATGPILGEKRDPVAPTMRSRTHRPERGLRDGKSRDRCVHGCSMWQDLPGGPRIESRKPREEGSQRSLGARHNPSQTRGAF